jgi:hypothetical protein
MGMCSQFLKRIVILFAVPAFLCGCGAMDTFLPSSGTYMVNARVGSLMLDEFSFISSGNKIYPFFENTVSGDPDVTALTLFLRDSRGEAVGWKVVYTLDANAVETGQVYDQIYKQGEQKSAVVNDGNESNIEGEPDGSSDDSAVSAETLQIIAPLKDGEELVVPVRSLDNNLPYFPVPSNLQWGRYTLVSQVMRGNQILQRNEMAFFYLSDVNFSFDSIQVHQSGISESSQLIPKGTVIMLEAKLDFDSRLDPYIVWYNGKRIISEGSFSEGAGNLLWKTPDQNGFTSIRAEAFPVKDRQRLAGYSKDISILVSAKKADIHLLSEDEHDVLYWYIFEGDLRETKSHGSPERFLKHARNISPRWMPSSGTFGLAAGTNDIYTLPGVPFSNRENKFWQILCRFKPLNAGEIFSVQFESPSAVTMSLTKNDKDIVLMLMSPTEVVSQTVSLPETDSFLTLGINFSIQPDRLTVKLDLLDGFNDQNEPPPKPFVINAETVGEFLVTLGSQPVNASVGPGRPAVFTALWDEFALLHLPFTPDKFTEEPSAKDVSSEEISLGEKERQASGVFISST